MIVNPPQQQLYSYHLLLSFVLLLLTVYPVLFNSNSNGNLVAAYSASELDLKHDLIDEFDVISSGDISISRAITTRSIPSDTSSYATDQYSTRKINFQSLGREFNLVVNKQDRLIAKDLTVVGIDRDEQATKIDYDKRNFRIYNGFVAGRPDSRASCSLDPDNKLTAHIHIDDDIILVEPIYLHRDHLQSSAHKTNNLSNITKNDDSMLVYKLKSHKQFKVDDLNGASVLHHSFNPARLCGALHAESMNLSSGFPSLPENDDSDADIFKYYVKPSKRTKRDIGVQLEQPRPKTRCTLHLVADYLFYKHVGNGDNQTTVNYLLALVNRVNQIYLPTVWTTDGDSSVTFKNIGFIVQDITIHQEYTRPPSSGDIHYNMKSDKVWGAREFLDNFSRHSPTRQYCLAHLLTYRKFDAPVLGLAYVASTRFGTIGGICSPTQQRGDLYYRHNTGISTSKGINGETLITRQADLVLAHELGHNLGAEHDSNECRPSFSDGGAYLMHPYSVLGFEKNNRFLSNCSRISIGRVIRRKGPSCFVPEVENVCGNGIVENDEECDGGDAGLGHSDPCCDSSCRFTPGSNCSDRHSWCCSQCRIVVAGQRCRAAEDFNCKQESYCDGRSAECPPPPPVEDDKVCVGRGLCRSGQCVPFCEARDLISCLCTNPADACKLCCKPSINSTCVPYDNRAPYLPDGVLCYRGVCEKGRCEQPIQDFVERLWDVIEDITLTAIVKFLRDNIILVVLVVSIPVWCIAVHFINEFDKRIKRDVITAIMNRGKRRRLSPAGQSPFLPRLFVDDDEANQGTIDGQGTMTGELTFV